MKLGILVNTDKHLRHLLGLVEAATNKGHEVEIFAMDEGTRLLDNKAFAALGSQNLVSVSVCDHSARELGLETSGRPEGITIGSQFNNATMANEADRMIVL